MPNRDPFITDVGGPIALRSESGEVRQILPRYGVLKWDTAKGAHQVVASGNDLEALCRIHGIPADQIYQLPGRR